LLVFAVVNLHHFVLDGAVWKLRDGRVARALLRSQPAEPGPEPIGAPRPWRAVLRPALWGAGVRCLAVALTDLWTVHVSYARAGDDTARASAALDRLRWIARDSPKLRARIGDQLARQGDSSGAVVQYRTSVALLPRADV